MYWFIDAIVTTTFCHEFLRTFQPSIMFIKPTRIYLKGIWNSSHSKICHSSSCYLVKQSLVMAPFRCKNKDWSGQNQNNVSEWNDISTHRLLFQWTSTLKIQLRVLVFSFFASKCLSCCSCLNSLHITCYSLYFLLFIVLKFYE
jgi:hypothetical protein